MGVLVRDQMLQDFVVQFRGQTDRQRGIDADLVLSKLGLGLAQVMGLEPLLEV